MVIKTDKAKEIDKKYQAETISRHNKEMNEAMRLARRDFIYQQQKTFQRLKNT